MTVAQDHDFQKKDLGSINDGVPWLVRVQCWFIVAVNGVSSLSTMNFAGMIVEHHRKMLSLRSFCSLVMGD